MRKFTFVGEKPSKTAIERGWTWQHGRLAAKQLFDALEVAGIEPADQLYMNLFQARRDGSRRLSPGVIGRLHKLVSERLTEAGIAHVAIVHPAARGRIRAKSRYAAHVCEQLGEKAA